MEHRVFAAHYALENMIPSVTWSTKPAQMVALAHGLPMEVLLLPDNTVKFASNAPLIVIYGSMLRDCV